MMPLPACTTMLRAISEIAVAINVGSGRSKPSRSAIARPSARAATRSSSVLITRRTSSLIPVIPLRQAIEQSRRFVEVECHLQRFEVQSELDHGDGYIRGDTDDHRVS